MDEEILKQIAEQLRKPTGEMGIEVAKLMNTGNERMNLWTIEQLKVLPEDNILEIGMGNGAFVKNILKQYNSVKYIGCDYSELMVEEATKLNKQFVENGQAQFNLSSAENLPFNEETFNKLFTINTIYFWEDAVKVLFEFHRVLKPKGILIITLSPKHILENIPVSKYGFNTHTKDEVSYLLTNNNFIITDVIERKEPDFEMEDLKVKNATVIVCAEKKANDS